MSNEVMTTTNKPVVELDGFNNFTDEVEGDDGINAIGSVIRGAKFKFLDPDWKIEERIVTGKRFTAVDVVNVSTKWSQDNKPLETHILAAGEKFPDFDSSMLNAQEANGACLSAKKLDPGADSTAYIWSTNSSTRTPGRRR